VLAGEGVAASAACLRERGRRPGGPVSAKERKEGEFGTDGTRTTATAERFTSTAAVGVPVRRLGSAGEGERFQGTGSSR
jgi:hypothetical protein